MPHGGGGAGAAGNRCAHAAVRGGGQIERVLVWGWDSTPTKVTLTEEGQPPRELGFAYNNGVLGLRKPGVHVLKDFTITIA